MDKRLCITTATPNRTNYILKSSCLNWCGLFLWVIIMAIKSVDITVPGGDTPRSAFTKINQNFSNSSHAASRSVGAAKNNLLAMGDFGLNDCGYASNNLQTIKHNNTSVQTGFYRALSDEYLGSKPFSAWSTIARVWQYGTVFTDISFTGGTYNARLAMRAVDTSTHVTGSGGTQQITANWVEFYSTGNTTTDSNGFIKAASPIVKVHNDKIVLNSDAERQNVTFKRNSTGDYTITTQSGLSTDGWYLELPKDLNGNPKVAVTLEETDGVISLKSYVRVFSMQTFTFEPDLSQPLDIPEGRWIDLRLNELPIDDVPAQ